MDQANRPHGRQSWGKSLRRLGVLLLIGLVILMGLLWWGQRFLTFPGAYVSHNVSPDPPQEVEVWTRPIDAGDAEVQAWLMPGRGATAENPGPAIVFCHGNGELINIWTGEMHWYTQRGYTVLLPEYRGYGQSGGSPKEQTIVEDLVAFYDRLVELPYVDADRVVYHGRSLGGGFVAQLAERRPPAAMILSSTFTSVVDIAQTMFPIPIPRFMIRTHLEVRGVLQEFDGPVLVLHGEEDEVIPVAHARANAEAAADSTLVTYPRTSHNNMPQGHGSWDDILPFLDRIGLPWQVVGE